MSGKEQPAIHAENSTSCSCHKYSNACTNLKTVWPPNMTSFNEWQRVQQIRSI